MVWRSRLTKSPLGRAGRVRFDSDGKAGLVMAGRVWFGSEGTAWQGSAGAYWLLVAVLVPAPLGAVRQACWV